MFLGYIINHLVQISRESDPYTIRYVHFTIIQDGGQYGGFTTEDFPILLIDF